MDPLTPCLPAVAGSWHRRAQNRGRGTRLGTYFDALGLRAIVGRLLTPDDDKTEGGHPRAPGGSPVTRLLAGTLRQTPGDRRQTLRVNNHPMEIIGVTPQGFEGVVSGNKSDVYLSIQMNHVVSRDTDNFSASSCP